MSRSRRHQFASYLALFAVLVAAGLLAVWQRKVASPNPSAPTSHAAVGETPTVPQTRGEWVPLYQTRFCREDLNAIPQILKESGAESQVDLENAQISVPESQLWAARGALIAHGLPSAETPSPSSRTPSPGLLYFSTLEDKVSETLHWAPGVTGGRLMLSHGPGGEVKGGSLGLVPEEFDGQPNERTLRGLVQLVNFSVPELPSRQFSISISGEAGARNRPFKQLYP